MSRELTRTEKASIRKLVTKWCANYDKEYGCLPLRLYQGFFGAISGRAVSFYGLPQFPRNAVNVSVFYVPELWIYGFPQSRKTLWEEEGQGNE